MTPSKPRGKEAQHYTEQDLEAAIKSVREGGKTRGEAARLHNVPRSTLFDRLKGRPPKSKVKKTILSTGEEGLLVDWIKKSANLGFGRTKNQVFASVEAIVNANDITTPFKNGKPGKKWFSLFMKRHKDLSVRTPQALGSQRAGVTTNKIKQWFYHAHQDIISQDPELLQDPHRIFNCDESGFQLGGGIAKVLAAKSEKRVYQVTTDTHQQKTVLACGSASGDVHPPLLIFPGQRFNYNPMDGFPEAHFARSGNGWIDSPIFRKWLETAFIPETKGLHKPIVLFVDGHKTHVTLEVCELCQQNGIILYQQPSHSSHIVQPLDLTTFKTLKQAWREEVLDYQVQRGDILGKKDFAKVFKQAWTNGIRPDIVKSGFRAAGIFPWDPQHVDLSKTGPSGLFQDDNLPPADVVTEENRPTTISLSPPHLIDDPPSPSPYPSALPPLSLVLDTASPSPAFEPPSSPAFALPSSPACIPLPTPSPAFAPPLSPVYIPLPPLSPAFAPPSSPAFAPPSSPAFAPTSSPAYAPTSLPAFAPTSSPALASPPSPACIPLPPPSPAFAPPPSPACIPLPPPSPVVTPPSSPAFAPPPLPAFAPPPSPAFAPPPSPALAPPPLPAFAPPPSPALAPPPSPAFAPTSSPAFVPPPSPAFAPTSSPAFVPPPSPAFAPPSSPAFVPPPSPAFAPTSSPAFAPSLPSPAFAPTSSPAFAPPPSPALAPPTSPAFTTSSSKALSSESSSSSYTGDLQKLLLLVANTDHATLARRIAMHDTGSQAECPEDKLFVSVYGRLAQLAHQADHQGQVPVRRGLSFETLELPSRWKGKARSTNVMLQPSNMLTSEAFLKFKNDTVKKKQEEEEERDRKKKEREEKKKLSEENKRRKREEQEKRKRDREEKKKQKEKNKAKNKKSAAPATDSDSESLSSRDCIAESDNDNSVDGINLDSESNICCGCHGEKEGYEWIGCDCGRWFHVECAGESCVEKSMDEIEKMVYVCHVCKNI